MKKEEMKAAIWLGHPFLIYIYHLVFTSVTNWRPFAASVFPLVDQSVVLLCVLQPWHGSKRSRLATEAHVLMILLTQPFNFGCR